MAENVITACYDPIVSVKLKKLIKKKFRVSLSELIPVFGVYLEGKA